MSPAPLELWGLSPLWITIAGSILLLTVEFSMKEEGRRIAPILTGTILVLALGAVSGC